MNFYSTPSLDFQDGISHPAAKPQRCKAATCKAATRKAATRKAAKPTNKLVTAQVHWNSKLTQVLRFQKQRVVSKTTLTARRSLEYFSEPPPKAMMSTATKQRRANVRTSDQMCACFCCCRPENERTGVYVT
jgi:hypothetical protein